MTRVIPGIDNKGTWNGTEADDDDDDDDAADAVADDCYGDGVDMIAITIVGRR